MDVRIGITTSLNDGEQRLHHSYVRAVEMAGGIPLIVPMLEDTAAIRSFARLLHGLVITGGPAITEGLIGRLPEDISETDPVRIRSDRAMLHAFLEARKPILGICYGMQLLNASAGGTIYADVQHQRADVITHSDKRGADRHEIHLVENSHLHRLLKKSNVEVNSRHIQAVATIGEAFRVAATAPDGVVEAIENADGSVLGVQFHPERMGDEMLPLFRHLVENARKVAAGGGNGT
ncbi:MAG: gamma-glutamyl-gamma-aminobutyrate hydrolase family protein [Rhodothermales bacterium]